MFDKLVELATNPYFLIAGIIGVVSLLLASQRPYRFVYLLAGFAVIVSITPPTLMDPSAYIGLWGPLESLRNNNRYVAVVFGAGLVFALHATGSKGGGLPLSAIALVITHLLILGKNLISVDDIVLSIIVFVGFLIVVSVYWSYISSFQNQRQLLDAFIKLMMITGAVFVVVNAFQFFVNRAATSIVGGRFHGITNNPQMFVISIAPFLPIAYYVVGWSRQGVAKIASIAAIIVCLYWSYSTGSRLSLLLLVVGFAVYYQMRVAELTGVVILGGLILLGLEFLEVGPEVSLESRVFSIEDTRTDVWLGQIRLFVENPIFGMDFGGARVSFGESTWFGAAASLGLLGLIPMLLLGLRTFQLIQKVWKSQHLFNSPAEKSMVLGVLSVAVAGTFFEAYLFGVLTLPMIVFLVCVMTMERLFALQENASSRAIPMNRRLLASLIKPRRAES